jgi:predicted phosphodiesterase
VDWEWYRNNAGGADVLVIAGDLSNSTDVAAASLKHAAQAYELVVFVDGNHEHYNKEPYSYNMGVLGAQCSRLSNVVFLSPTEPVFTHNHIAFVGANGWYDWRCHVRRGVSRENAYAAWRRQLNDAAMINFDRGDPGVLAKLHSNVLANEVHNLQQNETVSKIILVTHSSPRADNDSWRGEFAWDVITPSFVNSQMNQVLNLDSSAKISHWIYGHTHTRNDRVIEGVRYVNNCRGYPNELSPWSLVQIEV